MNEEEYKHIHNILELLEFMYCLYPDKKITLNILNVYNLYYKLFICKSLCFKCRNLLHIKNNLENTKNEIQPLIFTFLLENKLLNQLNIWNNSINHVNEISSKLLNMYIKTHL